MLPLQPIRPTVKLERGDAKSETACTKRNVRLDYRKGPFRLVSKLVVFRGETWRHRNFVVSKVRVHPRSEVRSQDIRVFTAVSQKTLEYLSCRRKQAITRISRAWKTDSALIDVHSRRFLLESRGLYSQL